MWWISEHRLTLPGMTGKSPEELGFAFPIMSNKIKRVSLGLQYAGSEQD